VSGAVPPRLRRIFPEPAELTVEAFLEELLARRVDRAPREDRPWLALNMVASADGRVALDGRSEGLSGPADRALFHALRATTDAVLFGANTANLERYGRMVKDPDRRAWRERDGLLPEPLAVCVSGELSVSAELPLFAELEARVVVATRADGRLEGARAEVDYVRLGDAGLDALMRALRSDHGVEHALCEGGPRLSATLLAEGLVDEFYLTIAPLLVGSPPFPVVQGPLAQPIRLELLDSIESAGTVFQRYGVAS